MNFKKYSNVLLVFFLLVSNLGMSFNVHYCEDEIASVSINTATNSHEVEKDCCGIIEKKSKCCKNKIIKSNEKFDQITTKSFSVDYNIVNNEWKPLVFTNAFNFQQKASISYYCNANSPPLYLLYSQYSFYG
jgi:uncharacterized protein with LGFP repeats